MRTVTDGGNVPGRRREPVVRAAVIGAGAMGAAFAAEATEAGQDVTVIDVDPDVVRRITERGVVVESDGPPLRVKVPATGDPATLGPVDLAIVFVKGHDTRSAADAVAALLGPQTVAVTLQNGWGNADILASVLPARQLVMGVTYHSCSAAGPGRVRHTGRGPTVVGPYLPDGDVSDARRVAAFLSEAGWGAEASAEVRTEIWKKLVLNAATLPTAGLTRLASRQLGAPGPVRDLIDALAGEAVAVARAQGLDLDVAERISQIHAVLDGAGGGKPSMLQDVEAGRKTEIEAVNGAVVRIGAQLGVATPLNQAMMALIHGVERSWRQ